MPDLCADRSDLWDAPEQLRWYRCVGCGREHVSMWGESLYCKTCLPDG